MGRPARVVGSAAAVLLAVAGGCGPGECIRTGPSVVELRLPSQFWGIAEYCVDETCLSPSQRVPMTDNAQGEAPYSYVVDVSDTPRVHHFRIKVTSPEGITYSREGDVETAGNRLGGEMIASQGVV
jgi:hypothetical protein